MISLGNIGIDEFMRRTGFNMSEEDIKILKLHHQENASILKHSDKFHIFDIPFSISVGDDFATELIEILTKYNEISVSKETLSVNRITESEVELKTRLRQEAYEKDKLKYAEAKANPETVWHIQRHLLVPVEVKNLNSDKIMSVYYGCWINTYTTGYDNIIDLIRGTGTISKSDDGLYGIAKLSSPEIDNDADQYADKYSTSIVGRGFFNKSGNYLGSGNLNTFDEVQFDLAECARLWRDIMSNDGLSIRINSY